MKFWHALISSTHLPHGIRRSICYKNFFFFVRVCDSSSIRPDRLICLFMSLFYHIFIPCTFALCGVATMLLPIFSNIIELICANPLMINNSSNTLCLGKCAKSLKYLQIWKQTGYPAISSRHYLALVRDISVVLPKNTSFF